MNNYNKIGIEENLLQIEELCPDLLNLFDIIYQISYSFLDAVGELLPEEPIEIEHHKMPIKNTIDLVREFLNIIDKKYLDIFDKSLNDGTFELFYEEDDLKERPNYPITTPVPYTSIYIPVKNTFEDGAVIVHEFFHYLNDSEDIIAVRDIFTEMISIYYELRYYQFLSTKGYVLNEYYNEIYDRINNSFDSANTLCFSSSALDIYDKTGNIDRKNIKFINEIRKTRKKNTRENRVLYKKDIGQIINFSRDNEFVDIIGEFREDLSYVLGTLLAFYSLNEPTLYDVKMKYINDNINNFSIEDVLNILDTKITDYPVWVEESAKNLKKALGVINEEDNMYSGSYRSRQN